VDASAQLQQPIDVTNEIIGSSEQPSRDRTLVRVLAQQNRGDVPRRVDRPHVAAQLEPARRRKLDGDEQQIGLEFNGKPQEVVAVLEQNALIAFLAEHAAQFLATLSGWLDHEHPTGSLDDGRRRR
jgi:hypothetical protein